MTLEQMKEIDGIREAVDNRCVELLRAARQHHFGKLSALDFQVTVEEIAYKLIEAVRVYEKP